MIDNSRNHHWQRVDLADDDGLVNNNPELYGKQRHYLKEHTKNV